MRTHRVCFEGEKDQKLHNSLVGDKPFLPTKIPTPTAEIGPHVQFAKLFLTPKLIPENFANSILEQFVIIFTTEKSPEIASESTCIIGM